MEASNLDRWLSLPFFGVALVASIIGITLGNNPARGWEMLGVTLGLLISSSRYNQTGHWAQFKWAGDRLNYYTNEGFFVVLWFLGYQAKSKDLRDQTTGLDPITVFTQDSVEVLFKGVRIVWRIVHLGLFNNLNPSDLPGLLDDVADRAIKLRVATGKLREVLVMRLDVEQVETTEDLKRWGIEVVRLIVPAVPEIVDSNVKAALQLQATERFQREGQTVELDFFADEVADLVRKGIPQAAAIEQAQLSLGSAERKKIQDYLLDPNGMAALVALLGARK